MKREWEFILTLILRLYGEIKFVVFFGRAPKNEGKERLNGKESK